MDLGVKEGLVDKSRSGRPQDISAESRAWIVSLACMKPKDLGYPHEIWTQRLLVKHIRENCINEGHPDLLKINQGTISKILNASKIKPHKISRYIAKVDPDFDQKATNVLNTYREAHLSSVSIRFVINVLLLMRFYVNLFYLSSTKSRMLKLNLSGDLTIYFLSC